MQVNELLRMAALAPQDARTHVGLFLTLTLPSRFHPVKRGPGRRLMANAQYDGSTPRDGQLWLRSMWAKARAALARQCVPMYGLRVAEPHHDATPHWHALIWAEDEAGAQAIEATVRKYWLSDDGQDRGALQHRVTATRMVDGSAAAVAKYLVQHLGPQNPRDVKAASERHSRVVTWASVWGIRRFRTIGMPTAGSGGRV